MSSNKFKEKYKNQIFYFWLAARGLVGAMLIISAVRMYASVGLEFKLMFANFNIPSPLLNTIWVILPWFKLYLGGFLLLGIFLRTTALFSAVFYAASLFVTAYVRFSDAHFVSSSCLLIPFESCTASTAFNVMLLIMSLVIYKSGFRRYTFESWVKEKGN